MRGRLRGLSVAMSVTCVLLGSVACADSPPERTAPPTTRVPTGAARPLSLSEVGQRYSDYSATGDEIAQDGGRSPDRIKPFVTKAEYQSEITPYQRIRESGNHQGGRIAVRR